MISRRSDREARESRVELGKVLTVFEEERAVIVPLAPKSGSYEVDTVRRRFTPPEAKEAEAERLHYNPAHHGTDGERSRRS